MSAAMRPVVHVWDQWAGCTKAAELVDDDIPGRPNIVRVIYLHSRPGARISRDRLRPEPVGELADGDDGQDAQDCYREWDWAGDAW